MSAHVEPAGDDYGWWCPDCNTSELFATYEDAKEDADNHNARWHEPSERDYDADRRAEREERMT